MAKDKKIEPKTTSRLAEYRTAVNSAIVKGIREALKRHKNAGNTVAVSRNGKLLTLLPDDITINE